MGNLFLLASISSSAFLFGQISCVGFLDVALYAALVVSDGRKLYDFKGHVYFYDS